MKGTEISEICGINPSSVTRDFNNTSFKMDNSEINISALFAATSADAIKLQKKYAALQLDAMQKSNDAIKLQRDEIQKVHDAISLQLSNEQSLTKHLKAATNISNKVNLDLNKENQQLKKQVESTQQLTTQSNTTKDENELLKSEINDLKTQNTALATDNKTLQSNCNDLESNCNGIASDKDSLQRSVNELQHSQKTLQELNDKLQLELNQLSDASMMIKTLHQKNEMQRTEILNFKTGQNSKNKLQDFFTSLSMVQFYTVIVLLGTFFVAFQKWSEFEIYQTGIGGKFTVFILAFLLSSSVIFTAFNKTKSMFLNYFVLSIFVFIEFINSAKFTGLFESVMWSGDFFKALGGALLLPTISVFVAHLNTASSKTYSLDAILLNIEKVCTDFKIDEISKFKNDFLERIIKNK
jgi:hypothetical protein